jgi:hypothetical protein
MTAFQQKVFPRARTEDMRELETGLIVVGVIEACGWGRETSHNFRHNIVPVRYHCGGWSEELNSRILLLAYMVYL